MSGSCWQAVFVLLQQFAKARGLSELFAGNVEKRIADARAIDSFRRVRLALQLYRTLRWSSQDIGWRANNLGPGWNAVIGLHAVLVVIVQLSKKLAVVVKLLRQRPPRITRASEERWILWSCISL